MDSDRRNALRPANPHDSARIVAGEKQESGVTGRCQGSALCVSKGGAPLPAVRSDIAKDTRLQPLRELLPDLFRSRPVRPASREAATFVLAAGVSPRGEVGKTTEPRSGGTAMTQTAAGVSPR
jgi:hypothetical protein